MLQKKNSIAVLNLLLNFTTMDPLILQCQFRCLQSGLINFLHLDPEVFNAYLKKVSIPIWGVHLFWPDGNYLFLSATWYAVLRCTMYFHIQNQEINLHICSDCTACCYCCNSFSQAMLYAHRVCALLAVVHVVPYPYLSVFYDKFTHSVFADIFMCGLSRKLFWQGIPHRAACIF